MTLKLLLLTLYLSIVMSSLVQGDIKDNNKPNDIPAKRARNLMILLTGARSHQENMLPRAANDMVDMPSRRKHDSMLSRENSQIEILPRSATGHKEILSMDGNMEKKSILFDPSCTGRFDLEFAITLDTLCKSCFNLFRDSNIDIECR